MALYHWIWLFIIQSVWAGSYIGMKVAVAEMPAAVVVFLRYGIVAALFISYWLLKGFPRFSRRHFWLLLGLGAANFGLAPFLQVYSLKMTQAVDVSIMIAFEPMITVAIAAMAIGERPGRKTLAAMALATLGMVILSGGQTGPGGLSILRLFGNLLFLASLTCEASVTVGGQPLGRKYSPGSLMGMMMVAGFFAGTAANSSTIFSFDFSTVSSGAWMAILFLALGCSIFSYIAWYRMAQLVPIHRIALSLFFQPLIGSLLGWGLLNEKLGLRTFLGAIVICASLAWWQIRR